MRDINVAGDYFFNVSRYEQALKFYKIAYKENPSSVLNKRLKLCSKRLDTQMKNEKYRQGFAAYKSGNTMLAKESFTKINDMYSLGVIAYEQQDFDNATAYFQKVDNSYATAACEYKSGNYEPAISFFLQDKSHPDADLFIAESYYKLNDFKNAEKYYYDALKNQDLSLDALYGLAWTHYKSKDFNSSASEFAQFSSQSSNDSLSPKAMYYAARAFYQADSTSKSIEYFCKLRTEYPQFTPMESTYYWLGKLYYKQSNFLSSVSEFQSLVSNYPQTTFAPEAYLLLGNAYYNLAKYDSAVHFYNEIKAPDWYVDEARFKIEECNFKHGRYGSYLEVLSNFIRKYPDSPRAPSLGLEIARYWVKRDRFPDAINAYNKVIQDFKWSTAVSDAKYGLAECYIRINKPDNAVKIYRDLLKTGFKQKAQLSIANTYFNLGEYDQAIYEYSTLIDSFPESPESKEAKYRIGLTYEILKKPSEARKLFSEIINEYPDDSRFWDIKLKIAKTFWDEGLTEPYRKALMEIEISGTKETSREAALILGMLYFEKPDYKTAKTFYLKAADKYDDNDSKARALMGAAKCAEKLSQPPEAVNLYEQVIALSPTPSLEQEAKEQLKKLNLKNK